MNSLPGHFIVNENGKFAEIILRDGGKLASVMWHQRAWEGATRFVTYNDAEYYLKCIRGSCLGIGASIVNFDADASYVCNINDVYTREVSISDLAAKLNIPMGQLISQLDTVIETPVYPYLEQVCQLHERIDLLYMVNGYMASFMNRDGDHTVCEATGDSMHIALTRLNQMVKNYKKGSDY